MRSFQQLPIGHKGLTKMIFYTLIYRKKEKRSGLTSFWRRKGKTYKSKYKPLHQQIRY